MYFSYLITIFILPFKGTQTKFIDFGENLGDTFLPKSDDQAFQVNLGFNFPYFNQVFSTCFISINGFISFGVDINYSHFTIPPKDKNIIAAFIFDLNSITGGNITYRSINDQNTLNVIGAEITSLLGLSSNFTSKNAFIITYDTVNAYQTPFKNASFQIILSTDEINSYLIINYGNIYLSSLYDSFYQYVNNTNYIGIKTFRWSSTSSNVNQSGKYIYALYKDNFYFTCYPLILKYNTTIWCNFTSNYSRNATFKINLGTTFSKQIYVSPSCASNCIENFNYNTSLAQTGTFTVSIADNSQQYSVSTNIRVYGDQDFALSCPTSQYIGNFFSCVLNIYYFNQISFLYYNGTSVSTLSYSASISYGILTTTLLLKFDLYGVYNISLQDTQTKRKIEYFINILETTNTTNSLFTATQDLTTMVDSKTVSITETISYLNSTFQISQLNANQLLNIMSSKIDASDCLNNCSQNGQCSFSNQLNKLVCNCSLFYFGSKCEIDTRPCSINRCSNNGTCIQNLTNPLSFNFYCECSKYYTGSNCENKIDLCQNETCSNNGRCVDVNDSPKCKCFNSYEGEKCEIIAKSLKLTKQVKSISTIIAIIIIIVLYSIFILFDLLRIFKVTKKIKNKKKFKKK